MKPRQIKKLNKQAKDLLINSFNGEFVDESFKFIDGVLMCYFCVRFDPFNDCEEYDWIEARHALYYKLFFKEMTIKECRQLAKAGVKFR